MLDFVENFFSMTPTADCVPARQIVADNDAFQAAVAEAAPTSVRGLCVREAHDNKAPEPLTREISNSHWGCSGE